MNWFSSFWVVHGFISGMVTACFRASWTLFSSAWTRARSSGVGALRLRFQFWILSRGKPHRLSSSETLGKGRTERSFSRVSIYGFRFVVLGFRSGILFGQRLGRGFC